MTTKELEEYNERLDRERQVDELHFIANYLSMNSMLWVEVEDGQLVIRHRTFDNTRHIKTVLSIAEYGIDKNDSGLEWRVKK